MEMLKVLILVNDNKQKTPLSKMSFKTLTNLRYLLIWDYELSDFSFLSHMKKLHALSLHGCSLPSFPELQTDVAITQLTTLKLLDLIECDIKGKKFELIKRTPLLEELYIVDIEGEWEAHSEDNIEFFNTFSVPQTLRRYGIVLGSRNFYDYNDGELFVSNHKTLLLNYFLLSNEVIKSLAKKAMNLFLANIEGGAKNIIPDIFQIEGGGLDELIKFEIRDSEEIECLIDTSNHEVVTLFSKLQSLRIDNMENLRVLWHCLLPAYGPFQNLEKLYLRDCPRLTSLFTYVVARSLVQLKILKISRCDELKHILEDDGKTEKSQDEFTTGHPVQIFQNLQEVEVNECRELKHIFSANIVRGLGQLKVLEIEKCLMLDQIIGNIVPSADQDKKEVDEIIEEGTLSSLVRLRINYCPRLGSIFKASTAKTLSSLEELFIQDCHSLKQIVTHEGWVDGNNKENIVDISIFQSLKKLHISGCYLLQLIFPVSFVGGMMKLDDIGNINATNLKYLSSPNRFEGNSRHQEENNTQIELPALEVLKLDGILDSTIQDSYPISCPSLGTLSLGIGRCVEFFTINCSTDASKATNGDCIAIKISNSDFVQPVESAQYLSRQPQGLNLLIMHTIKEIELRGFDKAKYLFKLSIASSLMLESLKIEECPGLEHIIDTDDEYGKDNLIAVFPNLRKLSVRDCCQLKYMFGQYPIANQDYKEIHIRFLALEILSLHNLPDFISTCATNTLTVMWPSLKEVQCHGCFYPFYDSFTVPMDLREPISTIRKDPKGIQNHFLTLQTLSIRNSEVKSIFCLNGHEMIGQQVSLRLEDLLLEYLPLMTDIWVASKNSITLQHLTTLEIMGCGKLKVIFPMSLLRCLPELNILKIRECKQLRQIIEEEVEDNTLSNLLSPQPCFPKLEALYVEGCHNLKTFFSGSASNDLPNLHLLIINGASELQELVGCGQGKCGKIGKTKVELPRLKLLIFMHLPNFQQETELPNLKNCIVYECPKLSLTSTTTFEKLHENFPYKDFENTSKLRWELKGFMRILNEDSTISGSSEFTLSQINEKSKTKFVEKDPGSEVLSNATLMDSDHKQRLLQSPSDICQHETHSQEIEEVENDIIKERPAVEEPKTKSLSTDVEDTRIGGGVATHVESSGVDIAAQDSKVFEDDKMNEGKAGIVASQGFQVEGLNLLVKQQGIEIVSNNNIDISPDIRTRLEAYKHFVDLNDAQIALVVEAITTYPHLWNASQKFSERFQAWRLKILADMLSFLQKESVDNVLPQREQEFLKLCEEAVQIGFEISWVDEICQRVVGIAQRQMDENPKRSSSMDMELDSQTVEQDDGLDENFKKPFVYLKTQNVNNNFEEGSNWTDKEGEIGVVSNHRIAAPRNEEPEKEFVAKVSTLEIPRIATSLTNLQQIERPTPSYLNIPLRETPSNALEDKQRISEPCLMNQQKSLSEIPQSIEREVVEKTIAKNTNIVSSSISFESAGSQLDQINTSHSISLPHGKEGEDNRVAKTVVELEKYLKMSLKEIVSSETNSLQLLSALNFLSNLPFKDVTLSDGLKDIIYTMHQEFSDILCSFKQGFATTDKLAMVEARRNEVAITLVSKISEAENFCDEAQLKEVVLKEQIIRLKEEIKVCEATLSSLEEEKTKCITETTRYKMELENVRKDKSQIVKDQRKVQQELFEVAYKWSILCSQYEYNSMTARNLS